MAFSTSAFDLDDSERRAALAEVRSNLALVAAVLRPTSGPGSGPGPAPPRHRRRRSRDEYVEALSLADEALVLASDPDACDPAVAPLATCHLYRGRAPAEVEAAGEAVAWLRDGPYENNDGDGDDDNNEDGDVSVVAAGLVGRPGDDVCRLVVGTGAVEVPVVVRPGPARRCSYHHVDLV